MLVLQFSNGQYLAIWREGDEYVLYPLQESMPHITWGQLSEILADNPIPRGGRIRRVTVDA